MSLVVCLLLVAIFSWEHSWVRARRARGVDVDVGSVNVQWDVLAGGVPGRQPKLCSPIPGQPDTLCQWQGSHSPRYILKVILKLSNYIVLLSYLARASSLFANLRTKWHKEGMASLPVKVRQPTTDSNSLQIKESWYNLCVFISLCPTELADCWLSPPYHHDKLWRVVVYACWQHDSGYPNRISRCSSCLYLILKRTVIRSWNMFILGKQTSHP